MQIVILGAGAIGRLFGVYLSRCGHQVTLVEPDLSVVDAINNQGLGFMEQDAEDRDAVVYVPARAVNHASAVSETDLTLLAVKSFDSMAAVGDATHLISKTAPIVTLQTGLGTIEQLERLVGRESIICGFTFMGAAALSRGVVRVGGVGKTYLGEITCEKSARVGELAELFTACNLVTTPVRRIIGRLWSKVIIFAAINAVSAVVQVKNGHLLESMESITLMKRLVDEGQHIARARSVDLVFPDLYQLLFDACRRTEHNISSMLQDILNGHRTEIDAQCGALVRFGEEAGVAAPTQQTMVELVRLMENKAAGRWAVEAER